MGDQWTNWKPRVADNRWLLMILSLTLIGVVGWLAYHYQPSKALHEQDLNFASKVVLVLFAALVGWFLDIFTGTATTRKVDQMVAFCYVFPFVIFAGILVPLFAYPVALPDPPKPVGILLGCSESPFLPKDQKLVPDGLRCDNNSDQWLVNIGGSAVHVKEYRRIEGLVNARLQAIADDQAAPDKAKLKATPEEKARADEKAKAQSAANTEEKARAEEKANADEKLKADKMAEACKRVKAGTPQPGDETLCSELPKINQSYIVTGGLVVPLYFVILAVFGGFVSMLRRVPEYQERVTVGASDPLSCERAREKLVFEVLQLLAAPLIAITAYYLVDPTSRSSTIAVGFIAGFSSEIVLMAIRALAEKIAPETTRKAPSIEATPQALVFARQNISTESAPQSVRLANRSASVLTGTATPSGDFICTPQGPFTVAPKGSIAFNVTFRPTTAGAKTGQLLITDDGAGSPRVISLSGEGQAPAPAPA